MKELDREVSKLEQLCDQLQSATDAETLKVRTLQVIAAFVSIATNIRDWL